MFRYGMLPDGAGPVSEPLRSVERGRWFGAKVGKTGGGIGDYQEGPVRGISVSEGSDGYRVVAAGAAASGIDYRRR